MSLWTHIWYWYCGLTMEEMFILTGVCVLGIPTLAGAIAIAAVVRKQKKGGEDDG